MEPRLSVIKRSGVKIYVVKKPHALKLLTREDPSISKLEDSQKPDSPKKPTPILSDLAKTKSQEKFVMDRKKTCQTFLARQRFESQLSQENSPDIKPNIVLHKDMTLENYQVFKQNPRKFLSTKKSPTSGIMYTTFLVGKRQYNNMLKQAGITNEDNDVELKYKKQLVPIQKQMENLDLYVKKTYTADEQRYQKALETSMSGVLQDTLSLNNSLESGSKTMLNSTLALPEKRTSAFDTDRVHKESPRLELLEYKHMKKGTKILHSKTFRGSLEDVNVSKTRLQSTVDDIKVVETMTMENPPGKIASPLLSRPAATISSFRSPRSTRNKRETVGLVSLGLQNQPSFRISDSTKQHPNSSVEVIKEECSQHLDSSKKIYKKIDLSKKDLENADSRLSKEKMLIGEKPNVKKMFENMIKQKMRYIRK